MSVYNRYKSFVGSDGNFKKIPFIPIPKKASDKTAYWQRGVSRLDILSYKYYGDANYGWLILQANPQLPTIEFEIEDREAIRIPYPLELTVTEYEKAIKIYSVTDGLN